jgi:hypothetical protein
MCMCYVYRHSMHACLYVYLSPYLSISPSYLSCFLVSAYQCMYLYLVMSTFMCVSACSSIRRFPFLFFSFCLSNIHLVSPSTHRPTYDELYRTYIICAGCKSNEFVSVNTKEQFLTLYNNRGLSRLHFVFIPCFLATFGYPI